MEGKRLKMLCQKTGLKDRVQMYILGWERWGMVVIILELHQAPLSNYSNAFFFRTAWRSPELLAGLWSRCKYCCWRLLILLSLNLVFCRVREKYYHLLWHIECRYKGCINTSRLCSIGILIMYSFTSHFSFSHWDPKLKIPLSEKKSLGCLPKGPIFLIASTV